MKTRKYAGKMPTDQIERAEGLLGPATGSAAACKLDNVRDATVTFNVRGNRWQILKALFNPMRPKITLVLPSSTIVISAKPQPNE